METPSNLKHFQKDIANVFLNLETVQHLVKRLSRKHRFRTSFGSQHFKESQTLVKSAWGHFYHIFWSLWVEMICNISPCLKFEILGVFVNIVTADDKHPVGDCKNLQFPIQMQLSWKPETLSEFFVKLMESK